MNKKGAFGRMFWLILLCAITVGYAVQMNPDFDIQAFKGNFEWNHIDINVEEAPDLGDAIEAILNGLGNAGFSIIKWFSEVAGDYPNVPFKLIYILVIFAIIAPILMFIIKFGVLLFILFKEIFQNRRDKKELRRLRKQQKAKKKIGQNIEISK